MVGEKLKLVARGTIRGYAHTPFLSAAVWSSNTDIGSGDERLKIVEIRARKAVKLIVVDHRELRTS